MHFEENCFYFLCLVDFFFGCGFKLNFSNITFPVNFFFIAQKEQYWYNYCIQKNVELLYAL